MYNWIAVYYTKDQNGITKIEMLHNAKQITALADKIMDEERKGERKTLVSIYAVGDCIADWS